MIKVKKQSKYQGIRERGAGSYEINFRPYRGALRIVRTIHAASKQEASLKRAELITETLKVQSSPEAQRNNVTFEEIWPIVERDIVTDELTHKTLLGLRKVYNRLFFDFRLKKYPHILSPNQLNVSFFHEYKSYYGVELNRPRGLRSETQRVKIIMQRLRKLRYCSKDLMEDLQEVKTPERRKKDYPELTATDVKALATRIKKDRPDLYGPIYFMIRTGRRVEETTLIDRNDISWDGFDPVKINIRAETTKTGASAPLNHLDDALRSHIRYYYQLNNKHAAPYLFLNNKHQKINQKMITKYLGKVTEGMFQVRITAHYFRHRFCTETCKAKLPLVDIQAICGIKDVKILINNYCHSSVEGQASVLEKTRV